MIDSKDYRLQARSARGFFQIPFIAFLATFLVASIILGLNLIPRYEGILTTVGWPLPIADELTSNPSDTRFHRLGLNIDIGFGILLSLLAGWAVAWYSNANRIAPKSYYLQSTLLFTAGLLVLANLVEYPHTCWGPTNISAPGMFPSRGWPNIYYQYVNYRALRHDAFSDSILENLSLAAGLLFISGLVAGFYWDEKERAANAKQRLNLSLIVAFGFAVAGLWVFINTLDYQSSGSDFACGWPMLMAERDMITANGEIVGQRELQIYFPQVLMNVIAGIFVLRISLLGFIACLYKRRTETKSVAGAAEG